MVARQKADAVRMGIAPGKAARKDALKAVQRIGAVVGQDMRALRRDAWLASVEHELNQGAATLRRLHGIPSGLGGSSGLGGEIGATLHKIVEARRRVAIRRVLMAQRARRLMPARSADAQSVAFRESDAEAIDAARAAQGLASGKSHP